jgi:hypothetical protein
MTGGLENMIDVPLYETLLREYTGLKGYFICG